MAEGVTEVEDAAEAGFPLVGGDDLGFDADGFGDDVVDEVVALVENVVAIGGEEAEEGLGRR